MKKLFLLTTLIVTVLLTAAQIIHVPADYSAIQAGIDAANIGDTILVEPGTYVENINFSGKGITVASLYLTTENPSYISQTIIDGNKAGSVVYFDNYESQAAVLCGFTITNGQSNYGGGIYCNYTRPSLKNLIISNNTALTYGGGIYCTYRNPVWENITITENISHRYGGGIYLKNSDPTITNVSITSNSAIGYYGYGGGIYCGDAADPKFHSVTIAENNGKSGGGIYADSDSKPVFDSIEQCNIYLNSALIGNDLYLTEAIDIKLDTFSVLYPTQFHALTATDVSFEIQHGMIEQVDADLFVSPAGSNGNSGLSAAEPLKTIRKALSLLRADSTHHHTIHLLDGVYSPSSTGETFPINLISHVDVQGESENETFLDAEDQSGVLHFVNCTDISISTLFITGGDDTYQGGGGIYCESSSPVINNITISGNSGYGILCRLVSDLDLQHLTIKNNAKGGVYCQGNSSPNFQDASIHHNSGDGIHISGGSPVLENVDVRNNLGNGIEFIRANPTLKKVNVTHNSGLGISFSGDSLPVFDSIDRCNIYLNNTQRGNDLYSNLPITIVVDTFTVLNPTDFYARPISNFTFDILHGMVEQVDADLYVSPEGDNNNSGLNEDDPLKTIRHALSIIIADSLNINTVHLANGVYSQSSNGESFPLELIDYVHLSGESETGVILDADGNSRVINIDNNKETEISSLTLTGGYAVGEAGCLNCYNSNLTLTNLTITNNTSYFSWYESGSIILDLNSSFVSLLGVTISENIGNAIHFYDSEVFLNNVEISNNTGGGIVSYYGSSTLQDIQINNNQGSGIVFNNESESLLQNVDITYNIGGIICSNSSPELVNVNITNNTRVSLYSEGAGGGINCSNANPILRNVRIVNNTADKGGGIYCTNNSKPVFDSINRCNIHSNDAVYGKDIYSMDSIDVIVDTFTVMLPTDYHAEPRSNFTFNILNGLLSQVNADLFVSPGGDNANSGLTPDEPLKTIDYATSVLIVDSTNQHTIHLLDGTYSPSITGEEFPVRIMNFINITGESEDATILDAEGLASVIYLSENTSSIISNLSVTGSLSHWKENGILCDHSSPVLNNLIIANNGGTGITCDNYSSPILENLSIMNNSEHGISCRNYSSPIIKNLSVMNNSGIGIQCYQNSNPNIQDIIIANNEGGGVSCNHYSSPGLQDVIISNNITERGGGLYCGYHSHPELKNVTIRDNRAVFGGGIFAEGGSESTPIFDSIDRCNIFLNDAVYGRDIFSQHEFMHVIVDTFTVIHPTDVYSNPIDKFTFDIQHGLIPQLNADLYVSPAGNNSNSGLSQDDPLKTIYHANSIMIADSNNLHTINLLDGIYSSSVNDEHFPVTLPKYVNITGQSENGVVLDAEGQSSVIGMVNNDSSYISNLNLTGGSAVNGGGIYCDHSNPVIQNVNIYNNEAIRGSGIYSAGWSALLLNNVSITQNIALDTNRTTYGGGAYFSEHSKPVLENVIISNNSAHSGGGIFSTYSDPYFKNTTISHNTAYYGGGINFVRYNAIFDSIERCNIYLNEAVVGKELYSTDYEIYNIVVDTFTVLNPTNYYAKDIDNFEFDILHGLVQQVDADLYVSPEGSNTNSGTSQDEPLKTIGHALSIMLVDKDNPHIIYLQDGVYSPSGTGENFPIFLIDAVNLVGTSADKVILDAEAQGSVICMQSNEHSNDIANMTITGGKSDYYGSGIQCWGHVDALNLQNLHISSNNGTGIYFGGYRLNLQNVVISNNTGDGIWNYYSHSILNNVTIVKNGGAGIRGDWIDSDFDISNSIIYNNEESIYSPNNFYGSIEYSNIEGGFEGEGNIDEDPVFVGSGNQPFSLSEDSPCIDAGTPDTNGLFLPPFDILGGPRIWNDRIDMGAYEWNNVGVEEFEVLSIEFRVNIYPNPFSTSTTIEYELKHPETVTINIYNHLGEQVDMIREKQSQGVQKIVWSPGKLPAGIYFIRLQAGEQVATGKMVVVK